MLRRHTQRLVTASLAVLALLSGALFYLDQQNGVAVATSRQMIGRTYVVERAFQSVNRILEEAESGERGYLLTGDIRHLKSYEETRESADREIQRLRDLTSDRPLHREHVEQLATLATRKLIEL